MKRPNSSSERLAAIYPLTTALTIASLLLGTIGGVLPPTAAHAQMIQAPASTPKAVPSTASISTQPHSRTATATAGNLTAVTDATSRTALSGYDAANRKTSSTDNAGKLTRYAYDKVGNRTNVTDATSRTVSSLYDALNRLVEERDDLAHANFYGYDAAGRKTSATDPNSNLTRYSYDALGHLGYVTDAASGVVSYEYDAAGNRTAMLDANLHRTTYGYDALNRLTRETDPEDRSTTTAYDDLASWVTVTRPDLTTVVKQLDELGRTSSLTRSDGTVSYGYDAASQLRTMADPSGTTTYDYDGAGRVSSVASPQGSVGYGYDAAGRRSRVDYPGSRSVNYTFDPAGRMWTLTDWASKTVTYGYDDAGRKTSQANPNGTSSSFAYDLAGRLGSTTHLSGGNTIAAFAYTPDPAGNPLSVAEVMSLVPGGTTSYTYDSLSRLRTVTYPDTTWSSYHYDPMGNRTELGTQGGTTTYAYDRSDRLLSTTGQQSLTFGWDGRGNQTGKGTSTFGYDQANRLATSSMGTSASYSYNGEGVRIGKTVGGVTTAYLQDVVGGLPHVLMETTGGQDTLFIYGAGLAFEVRPDGARRYYHPDALGSTRVVTDDAGAVISAFNYDAYGAVRQSAGEARSFTYTGEQTDESGLEFLRARTYDPSTGRFLQRDSLGGRSFDPRTLNRYGYAGNNPVMYVDPTGHAFWVPLIVAGGFVFGWLSTAPSVNAPAPGDTLIESGCIEQDRALLGVTSHDLQAGNWGMVALGMSNYVPGAAYLKQSRSLIPAIEALMKSRALQGSLRRLTSGLDRGAAGAVFQAERTLHYSADIVGMEYRQLFEGKVGYLDIVLSGNRVVDPKDWTGWARHSSSEQRDMLRHLQQQTDKYLSDTSYSLKFEFKEFVPELVLDQLEASKKAYGERLSWQVIP